MKPSLESLFRKATQTRTEDICLELVVAIQDLPASDVLRLLSTPANSRTTRQKYISAWILGELGYPKRPFATKRFQLLSEFASKHHPAMLRARAILSLGQMNTRAAWHAILPHQRDPNPKVRLAVAQALSTCHLPKAITALCRLSSDQNAQVREWAVFGLARPRLPHRRKILQVIRPRLSDKSRNVRIEAVIAQVEHRGNDWRSFLVRALEAEGVQRCLTDCVDTLINDIN